MCKCSNESCHFANGCTEVNEFTGKALAFKFIQCTNTTDIHALKLYFIYSWWKWITGEKYRIYVQNSYAFYNREDGYKTQRYDTSQCKLGYYVGHQHFFLIIDVFSVVLIRYFLRKKSFTLNIVLQQHKSIVFKVLRSFGRICFI